MYNLDKFKIKKVEEKNNVGKFEIGPLPKGFGYTIGNAIRRILLSSISGSAITSVKIKGISHEYTTIEGMQEDVLHVVVNLKNISIKSFSKEPVELHLLKKGKKGEVIEVKAGDFEKNSEIEICNPDLVIATLTSEKAELELDIVVENGIGYQIPQESKREESGVIPVDSIFSPVKHVKLDVSNARLGQQTDLDQILLEVFTSGSMTPSQALLESVEIFDLVANRLVDMAGGDSENNSLEEEEIKTEIIEEKKVLLSDLNLSTRLTNSLANSGISDLVLLEGKSKNEILSFKGMGKKSYEELISLLDEYDIKIIK